MERNDYQAGVLIELSTYLQANQVAHATGYRYHDMMVIENNPIDGALMVGDALKLIGNL